MTDLRCCVSSCGKPAVTIIRGCSLCDRCWEITDEIPEHVPGRYIDGIIMEVLDETLTGSSSLADALANRGFGRRV